MADSQKAIRDLMRSLWLFAAGRDQGEQPAVPIHIGPVGSEHTVYVTAATAEALADLVDGARGDTAGDGEDADEDSVPIDEDRIARSTACFTAFLEGQSGEFIASGQWSAATVAHNHRQLYADVTDVFLLIDPREITDQAMRDREVDFRTAAAALNDWFGQMDDPELTALYGDDDEDGQP